MSDSRPTYLPTRGHPLHGYEARQVATWLVRWSRRKPVCPLAPRAHTWLLGARRGRWPLSATRFYAILRYVEAQKRRSEGSRLSIRLTSTSPSPLVLNWDNSRNSMGVEGAGP